MTPLSDDTLRIGRAFANRTLPKSEWTHAAHLHAALWVLHEHGDHAYAVMPSLIRGYNEATGTANTATAGYHHTITLASLAAVRSCRDVFASPWAERDWLLDYWSRELLFSPEARAEWVGPDLAPLPFPEPPTGTAPPGPPAGP